MMISWNSKKVCSGKLIKQRLFVKKKKKFKVKSYPQTNLHFFSLIARSFRADGQCTISGTPKSNNCLLVSSIKSTGATWWLMVLFSLQINLVKVETAFLSLSLSLWEWANFKGINKNSSHFLFFYSKMN